MCLGIALAIKSLYYISKMTYSLPSLHRHFKFNMSFYGRLKTTLYYLWRRCCRTDYHGKCIAVYNDAPFPIEVFQRQHIRWLKFNSPFIQTAIDTRCPYKPILRYIEPMCSTLCMLKSNAKVLLLGMGAGGLIHYIRHHFPKMIIDAIENNPKVIKAAKKYFFIEESAHLSIQSMDAFSFLQSASQTYDCILVDLFSDSNFPSFLQTIDFYQSCKTALNPDGYLILNILIQEQQAFFQVMQPLRAVFNGQTLGISKKKSSNYIALASHQQPILETIEALLIKSSIRDVYWDSQLGLRGEFKAE